jgi:hypothetical protein
VSYWPFLALHDLQLICSAGIFEIKNKKCLADRTTNDSTLLNCKKYVAVSVRRYADANVRDAFIVLNGKTPMTCPCDHPVMPRLPPGTFTRSVAGWLTSP